MIKFKAGDKIRCIKQSDYDQFKVDMNKVHIIEAVVEDTYRSGIVLVGHPLTSDDKPALLDEKRFRIAEAWVVEDRTLSECSFAPRRLACQGPRIPLKPAPKRHEEVGAQVFNTWPTHHMGAAVLLNELD